MHEPAFLLFASDATLTALLAAGLFLIALFAGLAERRRARRTRIDAVGCMPWTTLSVFAFLTAAVLLFLAVKGWVAG